MRFAIFTHVINQEQEGRYYAYSPYVREMNLWFKYVEEVEVIAPRAPRGGVNGLPYEHLNLKITQIPSFSLLGVLEIFKAFFKIPIIFFRILGVMRRADHFHLRCPGNIGFLAAIAQIFFPKKPKSVKYAGNWNPEAKQPWTYRFQKWILSNTFLSRNIKVLVYGDWQNQSKNIVPFFTASFSEEEKEWIQKDFSSPYKFIFTGNLVEGKGVFEAIEIIESLNNKGVDVELNIYGDGILEASLVSYIQKKGLQKLIKLKGRKSLEQLKQAYKDAHFVILLSKSEGWPKTIAEGMWYGCIPVATDVSCVPWMLGNGSRGILISDIEKREEKKDILLNDEFQKNRQFECHDGSRDVSRTGFSEVAMETIISLLKNPEKLNEMSIASQEWSQQYTLEKFEKAIQEILGKHNRELKTDNYKQQTPNNKLKTENPELTTDTSELTTDNNNKQQATNPKQLRVLQLIDTLNPGGAERMAINLANSLVGEVKASYLGCTREEGMLKEELEEEVEYLFLNKTNSLDLKAFWKLRKFIKDKQIDLVHAHGTSWFWAVLLKLSGSKIKLVWHDHYGESELLSKRDIKFLKPLSRYFDGIISVNNDLKDWAEKELNCKRVIQLNNFIVPSKELDSELKLKGDPSDFKIICVANLRPQKDHLNLLSAFAALDIEKISLHLVGTDLGTSYSKTVREKISNSGKSIFYYGSIPNVSNILKQADLGVLSSRSEGLPLALLEYGFAGLPVVCTEVGQCREVVGAKALLVPPSNAETMAEAIEYYFDNPERRKKDAHGLQEKIKMEYSKESFQPVLLKFYADLS